MLDGVRAGATIRRVLAALLARNGEIAAVGASSTVPPLPVGSVPAISRPPARTNARSSTGFTPIEAIAIGTSNGAACLGRDARVGRIAVGKQADLLAVNGNAAATIGDVRNIELVFKRGVGFDPVTLVDSVRGRAGIW